MTTLKSFVLATCCLALSLGCSGESRSTDEHQVYFVGYAYNGATGARLDATQITAVSIKYRDKVIATKIEADGRFVSQTPLPTWQDYAVYITAVGFRPFVSRNPGVDVPASLAMTEALAGAKTVQTFQVEASLFPVDLKAPKVTLTIEQADALLTMPAPPRASGTVRWRPQAASVLETTAGQTSTAARRRWLNDEDLLTQTITKPFMEGKAEVAEGELLYGVAYQVSIFGVTGYQPLVLPDPLIAGQVSSRTITISKELRDQLRILLVNSENCVPPAGTSTEYGAALSVDFNEAIEFVGANAAEDIDNGVSVVPAGSSSGTTFYCSLKPSTSSMVQERGTKATIVGNRLTLTFNPSMGFSPGAGGTFGCTIPPSLTSVTYGNMSVIVVRPVGDPTRKRSMAEMLSSYFVSSGISASPTALTCGSRQSGF